MTVKELIAELKKCNPDAEIVVMDKLNFCDQLYWGVATEVQEGEFKERKGDFIPSKEVKTAVAILSN